MTGRPSSYTPEVAESICARLAEGESLRGICDENDMPDGETVRRWLNSFPEFRVRYTRAREDQAHAMFERGVRIATREEGVGDHHDRRLAYDALKWAASKLAPKVYGDKIDHTLAAPDGGPVTFSWASDGNK